MTRPNLDELDTLLEAFDIASRALDRGMHRPGGASDAEWQAEDDARVALRGARRAYIAEVREIIAKSAKYQRGSRAGHHDFNNGLPETLMHESDSGEERITGKCPMCGGVPHVIPN